MGLSPVEVEGARILGGRGLGGVKYKRDARVRRGEKGEERGGEKCE